MGIPAGRYGEDVVEDFEEGEESDAAETGVAVLEESEDLGERAGLVVGTDHARGRVFDDFLAVHGDGGEGGLVVLRGVEVGFGLGFGFGLFVGFGFGFGFGLFGTGRRMRRLFLFLLFFLYLLLLFHFFFFGCLFLHFDLLRNVNCTIFLNCWKIFIIMICLYLDIMRNNTQ